VTILGHFIYWVVILLMMIGFYTLIARANLVKKLIGLGIFQNAVFLLFVAMGKVEGGTAPILVAREGVVYSNPLPHALILTAIVVGMATLSLGLGLIIRIRESFGTVEEDEIHEKDESF
jgi:multicomponent Na+:H+ antiporter subunit C